MKLIRNTTKLSNAEVMILVKELDQFFVASGLIALGETPYKLIDDKIVQTGSVHNAEIVVKH